jgi:TetR/AcrR family transcriptional repressor of nem operon
MNKASTTSDAILACARALIASGGYNGFSYADIADVVGIRKASIHLYPVLEDLHSRCQRALLYLRPAGR